MPPSSRAAFLFAVGNSRIEENGAIVKSAICGWGTGGGARAQTPAENLHADLIWVCTNLQPQNGREPEHGGTSLTNSLIWRRGTSLFRNHVVVEAWHIFEAILCILFLFSRCAILFHYQQKILPKKGRIMDVSSGRLGTYRPQKATQCDVNGRSHIQHVFFFFC